MHYSRCFRASFIIVAFLLIAARFLPGATALAGSYKVYSTYLWHLQQPNYWPEKRSSQNRYMFAYEHLSGSTTYPGHPQNNIGAIFGKDDRVAIYQYRSRDAVAAMGQPDGGAQLSYSGCLIENIRSLGNNYSLGYGPDWNSAIQEGKRRCLRLAQQGGPDQSAQQRRLVFRGNRRPRNGRKQM